MTPQTSEDVPAADHTVATCPRLAFEILVLPGETVCGACQRCEELPAEEEK